MGDHSFWETFVPHDINYFCLPVYDHFHGRQYHEQSVYEELDLKRMQEDLASELMRSEGYTKSNHKAKRRERIRRLLFRLAEDVFCCAEESELTLFAPTLKEALEHAERLSSKYGKEKPAEQPGFYLLKVRSGNIHAECIKITRPVAMGADDLGLHYGPDMVEFEQSLIASLQDQTGG